MKVVREKAVRLISLELYPEVPGRESLRCFDAPNKRVHCYTEWKQKRSCDDMNPGAKPSAYFSVGARMRLT